MKTFLGILELGALAGIFYLVYKKFISPDNNEGTKTCPDGSVISKSQSCPKTIGNGLSQSEPPIPNASSINIPLGFRSILINKQEAIPAGAPTSMTLAPYIKSAIGEAPKSAIHFEVNFQDNCPQYIFYKGNYYGYHGTQTNESGIKTCYYRFSKDLLPDVLDMYSGIVQPSCSFNVYIGYIKYKYKEVKSQPSGTHLNFYCSYTKQ